MHVDKASALYAPQLRTPPTNIQAEQSLLGGIFANNKAYYQVAEFLRPEHFADEINGTIYRVASHRIEAGKLTDPVTLRAEFDAVGMLGEVGGIDYLVDLLTAMVSPNHIREYGVAIHEAWMRRQLIDIGREITDRAFQPPPDTNGTALIDLADQSLSAIADGQAGANAPVKIGDAVRMALAEGEDARLGTNVQAVSTGFPSLDDKILKLRPGHLVVIGGRPSMGKTGLARGIALNVATGFSFTPDGRETSDPSAALPVAYFSLEEEAADFGASTLAQTADISTRDVLDGTGDVAAMSRAVAMAGRLDDAPLYLYRKPRQSLRDITVAARQLKRRLNRRLGLIVVDYLQLMPYPPGLKDVRLSVGQNAYGLKDLAKDLGCAVILLSQLSRSLEARADKRPVMSDLRETGEIEDAADVIMFPYREEYYLGRERPKFGPEDTDSSFRQKLADWQASVEAIAGKAEILIPKVKKGHAPAQVDLRWNGKRTRFEEMSTYHPEFSESYF